MVGFRGTVATVVAVVLMVGLAGCAVPDAPRDVPVATPAVVATPEPEATASTTAPTPTSSEGTVTFTAVVDGDTIETSAGTIRIIGIDAPERGECGHDQASAVIADVLAPGDAVSLELPAGQNDQDRHGRLIRFVTTVAGADLGMLQLRAGTAVARYDSRDGYPQHPREAEYHAAQRATLADDGTVIALGCSTPTPPPDAPPASDKWWEQYTSCTKLKRNTLGHPTGPFHRDDPAQAEPYDWFANRTGNNGDGDGDGLACE